MNVPHPCGPLRHALAVLPLLLCQLFLSTSTEAQDGTSESSGRLTTGAIVVIVRDARGEPLTMPATVSLYSSDGMPMGQLSIVSGRQATFRNIRPGSYTVEVEASGYTKVREGAMLPMTGEVHVDVYLHPESSTDPVVLSGPGVPLLAPKAKKELEAGLAALRSGDLNKAQKHLESAGHLAPNHPEVLYLLGMLYMQTNDLPRAEGFLGKATQMDPQQAPAQTALGVVLVNERKFGEALPPLGKALELDARSWEARWALARCYYYQRNYEGAVRESRQALQDSNEKAPEIGLVVAASLTALGRYEESGAILREFLQQHPDNRGAARARRWLDHLQQSGKINQK